MAVEPSTITSGNPKVILFSQVTLTESYFESMEEELLILILNLDLNQKILDRPSPLKQLSRFLGSLIPEILFNFLNKRLNGINYQYILCFSFLIMDIKLYGTPSTHLDYSQNDSIAIIL